MRNPRLHRRSVTTPEAGYWHALVADSYLQQHRYGNAFHHYRQALARLPNLSSLHVSLATVYRKSGHLDWANPDFSPRG
jgi:Tfp pilus assembly protein PilF